MKFNIFSQKMQRAFMRLYLCICICVNVFVHWAAVSKPVLIKAKDPLTVKSGRKSCSRGRELIVGGMPPDALSKYSYYQYYLLYCVCVFVYLYLQEQIVGGMSPNALPQSCYYQY